MDISKMSVTELESLAYREIVKRDQANSNIRNIQNQIAVLRTKEINDSKKEKADGKSNTDQSASK